MTSRQMLVGFVALSFVLSGCAYAGGASFNLQDCLKSTYGEALIRIDDSNQRAFLVANAKSDREQLVALVRKGEGCMASDPQWAQRYSLSMFSAARFAGYMTDEHILPLVKSGQWETSYLAEYDQASKTLVLMPIVAPEEVHLSSDRQ